MSRARPAPAAASDAASTAGSSAPRHPALPPGPVRRVLMVCLGNICRSPTAEEVLRHHLRRLGLADVVTVDSAGTHAGMVGSPPDDRSIAHAARRGYDLSALRARRMSEADFEAFDLLVAMDAGNAGVMRERCPAARQGRVVRLLDFLPPGAPPRGAAGGDVPDPYYGGPAGFERVLDLIEAGCDGLAAALAADHAPTRAGL